MIKNIPLPGTDDVHDEIFWKSTLESKLVGNSHFSNLIFNFTWIPHNVLFKCPFQISLDSQTFPFQISFSHLTFKIPFQTSVSNVLFNFPFQKLNDPKKP
jgi:hypothetical protein